MDYIKSGLMELLSEIVLCDWYVKRGEDVDKMYIHGLKSAYATVTGNHPDVYINAKDNSFVVCFELGLTDEYDDIMEYHHGSIVDTGKLPRYEVVFSEDFI